MSAEIRRLQYRLRNKARLFDVGQAVHASCKQIIRKDGVVLKPYTKMLERMHTQSVCFLALAMLQSVLLWVKRELDPLTLTLLVLCLLCAVILPLVQRTARDNYDKALKMYLADNGEMGYILFDETEMTDYSEKGSRTVLPWAEYKACVMTEDVIVMLFERPVMLLFSRDEQTERDLREVLQAYGKGDTVHHASVKAGRREAL